MFIVGKLDDLAKEEKAGQVPAVLWKNEDTLESSDLYVVRVNEDNKIHLKNHVKYTANQILDARSSMTDLKSEVPPIVRPNAFADADGKRARFEKMGNVSIPAGESGVVNYTMPEDSMINKGNIIIDGGNYGDTISFHVIYPIGDILLDPFINDWFIAPDSAFSVDAGYPALVPAGLILRVTYDNNGSEPATMYCNLFRHKKV